MWKDVSTLIFVQKDDANRNLLAIAKFLVKLFHC